MARGLRSTPIPVVVLLLLGAGCASTPGNHIEGPDPAALHARRVVDVLYPVFRFSEEEGRRDTTLYPLYWERVRTDEGGRYDRDWGVFPLFLGGNDPEEGDYLLFFPFWGNLKGLLGKDEMRFRLFPLYLDAVEADYESTHLLWPLISWGEGDDRSDFRFLPFFSRREKQGTSHSTSILWPILTWGEEGLNTDHPISSFFLFPFYGRSDSDVAWSRTFLFPLFSFAGAEGGFSETNLLWPVYRKMESPTGQHVLRVWPFLGIDRKGLKRDDFYAWPIVWDRYYVVPEGAVRSFQIVPFWRETELLGPSGEDRGGTAQLWPLYRKKHAADGSWSLKALAPIPVKWDALERSIGAIWTLFEAEGGGERGGFRLLGGLVGHERTPEGGAIRLLWFLRVPI